MKLLSLIKELFILSVATLIIAIAVYFFQVPNHVSISSISGFSIVLIKFIPFSMAQITMFLNTVLLVIGFFTCGSEFGYKTIYTSILLPVFLGIFEKLFPNVPSPTGDAFLDVVCYTFIVSIGLAILFNRNASSGGLDIVAKILNKYLRIELGKALSVSGMCIALSSFLAYDTKTVILSVLGTYLNGIVLDHFIFDQNLKRRVCIVSPKKDEIREFILNDLHSGATIYKAIGAYHLEEREEIITIVDKHEFQKLMSFIDTIDPQAFITVYQVSNIQYRSKALPERKFN
ncbi:YitT family protein [Oribacterium sp. P6A1]|uniref:YitT family protein n=1 Tax=Oribacterium sp. P6A1 TaxID=1410612 RepID=UPI00055FCD29|nr:YitT family protein [Oribacterium sp. P6A1]